MPRFHTSKFFVWRRTVLACALTIVVASTVTCSADEKGNPDDSRTQRAADLDAKVASVKDQFDLLKSKLTEASAQAKENLRAELEVATNDLATAYGEREVALEDGIKKLSASLDAKWKELEQEGQLTKAEAARKLDELRQSWNSSYAQLRQSQQERVTHYRNELAAIEEQVATASDELNADWIVGRAAARQRYEETSAAMRESYVESIASLEIEIDRLRAGARKASDENKSKFIALADSLLEQTNTLHQELQKSYQETAEKANRYLDQTYAKLATAGAEAKKQIRLEAEQVSAKACELNGEFAAGSEHYRESLGQQLDSVQRRAAIAKGEAKERLTKMEVRLRAQIDRASEQVSRAYASYVAALTSDIDHLKVRLSAADETSRAKIVEQIDRRQKDLERVKQQLQQAKD